MSQIIAIHREDDHAIDFAWDSYIADCDCFLTLDSETRKVERYELMGGIELAIGVTGMLPLLQFLHANIEAVFDDLPAPTAKGIVNSIVPWMRSTFQEADVFKDGTVKIGENDNSCFVVGLTGEDMSVLALVSTKLAVVTYAQPIISIGATFKEVQALYNYRRREGRPTDREWMESALATCHEMSAYVQPPWCGCTIGGKR